MSRPADDRQAARNAQALAVRDAMGPEAAAFAAECRELMDCRMVSLQTSALCIGKPDDEPGIAVGDMVIESLPTKRSVR